jgi:hypothetical protein
MGYMAHHAIIVTGWDPIQVRTAHDEARKIFGSLVTEIVTSEINGYQTFFVGPDGSKEGWDESDAGNARRDQFRTWLCSIKNQWLDVVELRYGGDEPDMGGVTWYYEQPDDK